MLIPCRLSGGSFSGKLELVSQKMKGEISSGVMLILERFRRIPKVFQMSYQSWEATHGWAWNGKLWMGVSLEEFIHE